MAPGEYSSEGKNSLYLVWGPPLCGQLMWMSRELMYEGSLQMPTFISFQQVVGSPVEPTVILGEIDAMIEKLDNQGQEGQLYFELPWSMTRHLGMLEEWVLQHKDFIDEEGRWLLNMVGLLPYDMISLPQACRDRFEFFAKETLSKVVVLKAEDEAEDTDFVRKLFPDFSKSIEVLWENAWEEAEVIENYRYLAASQEEEFSCTSKILSCDEDYLFELFIKIAQGKLGQVWGAEAVWKDEQGALVAKTFCNGRLLEWSVVEPFLWQQLPSNGCFFNLAGRHLKIEELEKDNYSSNLF